MAQLNIPPIREPSRRDRDDFDPVEDAIRRARARATPAKPFRPIAEAKEEVRDEVKKLRKKAADIESPETSEEDIYTIADSDSEVPSDAPVYNMRQSKQQGDGQDTFQGQSSQSDSKTSFETLMKETVPDKAATSQPVQNTFTSFNQLAQPRRANAPTTARDSPFAVYKNMTAKSSPSPSPSPMKNLDKKNAELEHGLEEVSSDERTAEDVYEPVVADERTGELAHLSSDDPFPADKKSKLGEPVESPVEDYESPIAEAKAPPLKTVMKQAIVHTDRAVREQIAEAESFKGKAEASAEVQQSEETVFTTDTAAEKKALRTHQEQVEAGVINPFASGAQIGLAQVGKDKKEMSEAEVSHNLLKLVEQIVKELHNIELKGQTDTIILLNQPPMFQNSRVVITSFNSATKEFNLSFEGLTGAAKKLLDSNMDSLRETLEKNGYANALHIITTTTIVEHHIPGEHEQREKDREGRGGQQQQNSADEESDFDT